MDLRDLKKDTERNKLLEEFYEYFLNIYFPIKEQLDPFERISNALDPASDTFYESIVHVVVVFDEQKKEMIGGSLFEFFSESTCGLISYFCVKEEYRKSGLGRVLIENACNVMDSDSVKLRGKECYAILLETNSPLRLIKKDSFPPEKRLGVLSNLGCDLVDFEFIQPPLDPKLRIDTNLILLYLNRDKKRFLDGNILLSFIKEYWEICNASLEHPFFLRTISLLYSKTVLVKPLTIDNIRRIDYCVSGIYPMPLTSTSALKAKISPAESKNKFKSNL
jgi:GNAT superfamily N-acetyltransferase